MEAGVREGDVEGGEIKNESRSILEKEKWEHH